MSESGTEIDPCMITTCTELQSINDGLTLNYKLANNIDCSDTINWNSGAGFMPIGTDSSNSFLGSFNGNNHIISNLKINLPAGHSVGLFGYSMGTISNVGLIDVNVIGYYYVGGLAGRLYYGTISNCYSTGSVSGAFEVGGLVGYQSGGTVSNSYSTGSATASDYVGGLVGYQIGGTVSNSYSTGSVSSSGSHVGGLVGYYASGPI